ncbi:MAG: Ig-like domain-containing protein [Candidatus Thorarchaeota archaeon]|nr:Ig-like domain-containing protein [Candidatus Thorarchaeota archaeon]
MPCERHRRYRWYATLILCLITIIFFIFPAHVDATELYNLNDHSINAYSLSYFPVQLSEGGGMAGWFRITNGDGINFFIVDSFGHDEIQTTGSATTAHKLADYPRNDGRWYYWNFIALDTDTWYVYFSKALGTTYAGSSAELDIIIRSDTIPPTITYSIDSGTLSGDVIIAFSAIDDCFPIDRVEFYVDSALQATSSNTNLETGYVYEGTFTWQSYNWQNGNHNLSLRAFDTLGKGSSYIFTVTIQNELWDNPTIIFAIIAISLTAVVCYCNLSSRRPRR